MLGKTCFLIFCASILLCPPKSSHRCEKQPVITVDSIFHKFLELYSLLFEKNVFQRIHSNHPTPPPAPHPFNNQNPLSMMKAFCQCCLILFGDQLQMLLMVLKYMTLYLSKVSYLYVIVCLYETIGLQAIKDIFPHSFTHTLFL